MQCENKRYGCLIFHVSAMFLVKVQIIDRRFVFFNSGFMFVLPCKPYLWSIAAPNILETYSSD